MCFQIFLHAVFTSGRKATLVTFDWLVSDMSFLKVPLSFPHKMMHNRTDCIYLPFLHYEFSSKISSEMRKEMHNYIVCLFDFFVDLFDFSPVWIFKCLLKALAWEDAKSHRLHLFDFSPECFIKCILNALLWTHLYSHWLQWCDFSPVCVSRCDLKELAFEDA